MEDANAPGGPRPKRKGIVIGAIMLIVLLAGAAFVGGRLLAPAGTQGGLVPGGIASGGKQAIHLEVVPASGWKSW